MVNSNKQQIEEKESIDKLDWYGLQIGESISFVYNKELTRVPCGWVLLYYGEYGKAICFIQYNEEGLQ